MAPRIVVAGAGFGGLRVARALARAPVDVVLVDRNNYHLFQPLLYQVAMAGLWPESIAQPVRRILRGQRNLDFHLAEVTGVDLESRRLLTGPGPVPYDVLVLALGSETSFYGIPGVTRYGMGLKSLGDAVTIRNHVLTCFEQALLDTDAESRRALLTFVVVGGGPTGVEMAGALAELIRLVLVRDTPKLNVQDVRILLLEAGQRLLGGMRPSFSSFTAETLWRKHVEVRFGAAVVDFDGASVRLGGGEVIPARSLIWAAGVQAAPAAALLGVSPGPQGRVRVTPTLQLPGRDDVFVIGDCAYLEAGGAPLPLLAPVAIQMADTVVANLRRRLTGAPPREFRYKDPGSLATIGRNAAVAQFKKLAFHGFTAWVVWLVVHIMQLIGFRRKLLVLINWAWEYVFYERDSRMITRS